MKGKLPDAHLGTRLEEYAYLGLTPGKVAPWEDGVRTTGKRGEFEWWYFDSKMDDGSSLVIVFFTAPFVSVKKGYQPSVSLHLVRPDGTEIEDELKVDASECSFSRDRCYARIGDSIFEGDLNRYTIRYRTKKVQANVVLEGNVNPWKPATGHIFFGRKDYFAWLPSVPEGTVKAAVRTHETKEQFTGTGYHDHNWGNTAMFQMMHHWYWGRAKVGDYQMITCYITAARKYGYEHFPIFMLAKGRELIGDNTDHLTFTQTDAVFDDVTKKHYHKKLIYDYDDGNVHYCITYRAEECLDRQDMTSDVPAVKTNPAVITAMHLMKLAPSYNRFGGTVTLERFEGEQVVEEIAAPAIWELMYFGQDEEV